MRGKADLAFLARTPGWREIVFESLFTDDCVAVSPRDHPLAGRQQVTLEELAYHALAAPPAGTGLRAMMQSACQVAGLVFAPAQEAVSLTALLALVEAGFGIILMPSLFARTLDPTCYHI